MVEPTEKTGRKTADEEYDDDDIDPKTATDDEKDEYLEIVKKDFKYDLLGHDNYIQSLDPYEAMLISKPYDSVSKKVSTGLSDGRTTTIYQERAARVMAQLPTGQMKAAGKKDGGAGAVLDIVYQKHLCPNANAQAPLLEKFRNWQFYSSVYGFMPMYYDWNVTQTGYVGPDCWLWHPRNFIPQIGRASVEDMDYCHAITYVSEEFLEGLLEEPEDAGWDTDEVKILLKVVRDKTHDVSSQRDSLITRERQSQSERGRIMLATRYEAGEDGNWVVFAPEYNGVMIRMIRNPHKNGHIPFVVKYATPLFDNFYGLGDFQRAKPLQFASDGLDNFYFAGIKRGLYPPTIINPAGVVKSSITQDPGAIWQETTPNSIREYRTDPVGLSTYQAAKTLMNGAMLNQAGTTDTSQTAGNTSDPGFGKTPEAIQNQSQRESTRDNQDRFYLESKIEVLIDRMMGLYGTIGTEDIPVNLFVEDFEEIDAAGWSDELKGMLEISDSGQSARMSIKPGLFKDLETRFQLDPTSTAKADKTTQLNSLENFIKSMSSLQNEMTEIRNQGMTIDWKLVAEIEGELSDVPRMGKVFRQMTPQEQQMYQQQQQAASGVQTPEQKMIDNTNYKDLPEWAQSQWLIRQGYQQPAGSDLMTADQKLKMADTAAKVHNTNTNSPENQVLNTPPPPAPAPAEPAPPTPDQPQTAAPIVTSGGHTIYDPTLQKAHQTIQDMVHAK
jgi:hypothetical protein